MSFNRSRSGGLSLAYAECRELTRRHGKTYYFSTQFFPRHLRKSVYALYGFVRYPDELVDNPSPGSNPTDLLNDYRKATLHSLHVDCECLPVLKAFADAARCHHIPEEYAMAFLDAMELDLTRSRYETFEDLLTYTYGSASVVGLMMCCIIGAPRPVSFQAAHDLGLAMQLTNFLRDIGEDWRERQRIYIPLDEMKTFGYTEADLAAGIVNENFKALMRFQIERARSFYASADTGIKMIPANSQLPVKLARILYSRILNRIEENDYDVFRVRASTSTVEKATVAMSQVIHGLRA